jgi:putative N6-adenine-specific DNA methylase
VTPTASNLDCYAIVAPGLESFALAEAQALGLDAVLEEGGVAWTGDAHSALLANAGLRIASRVLVRLASFEARSFAELERHARKVPWARVLNAGDSVRFRVTCKKSRLYHSDAVAQRLADAVMRVVPGVRAHGGSVTEEEIIDADTALIVVRVMRDRVTVSADSSGELLHRRGYRQATAKAPLRETIAAAMLAASGWDDASPLVDPLCGSGTIPIEAAMRARHLAPGAHRTFAMERWPTVSRGLGEQVRAELAVRALPSTRAMILGSDRDAGAMVAANSNADRAGVAGDVRWGERSLSAAEFPDARKGWVVTNPPYGVRVGEADRVRDLWAQLGNVLRDRAAGWTVALLSPDVALEKQLRVPLRAAASTSNGGIPVRVMVGVVPG